MDATKLAACLDLTFATPCAIPVAQAQTGYLVGGTCPFVTKTKLKVYIEASLLSYEQVYINGGARGLILKMNPRDIVRMCQAQEVSVGEKSIINTRGKNTMDARGQKQKKKEKALSPEEIARVCELRRSQLDELEALESIFMEDGEFAVNDAMLIEEMTELLDEYEDDPDSAEGASAGKRVCEMPVIRFRIRLVLAVNMNRNGEGDSSDTEEAGVDADDLSKGPEADVDLHVCVLFPLAYPEEEAARITIGKSVISV